MCLARSSFTSLCRGTGCYIPLVGFRYQSCFPPWRTSEHPSASSLRIRSVRFIRPQARRLCECRGFRRLSGPGRDRGDSLPIPAASHLGSGNRETPQNTRATCFRLASERNGRCSRNHFTSVGVPRAQRRRGDTEGRKTASTPPPKRGRGLSTRCTRVCGSACRRPIQASPRCAPPITKIACSIYERLLTGVP